MTGQGGGSFHDQELRICSSAFAFRTYSTAFFVTHILFPLYGGFVFGLRSFQYWATFWGLRALLDGLDLTDSPSYPCEYDSDICECLVGKHRKYLVVQVSGSTQVGGGGTSCTFCRNKQSNVVPFVVTFLTLNRLQRRSNCLVGTARALL